jgi:hypothetical protein
MKQQIVDDGERGKRKNGVAAIVVAVPATVPVRCNLAGSVVAILHQLNFTRILGRVSLEIHLNLASLETAATAAAVATAVMATTADVNGAVTAAFVQPTRTVSYTQAATRHRPGRSRIGRTRQRSTMCSCPVSRPPGRSGCLTIRRRVNAAGSAEQSSSSSVNEDAF